MTSLYKHHFPFTPLCLCYLLNAECTLYHDRSPVHPSIFATASSNGTINLWNLAASLEQPISGSDGIQIDSDSGLNRIQWSADGRRMAVASGDKLHVLGVEEELCKSKGDEDSKVMSNLMSRGLIQGDVE